MGDELAVEERGVEEGRWGGCVIWGKLWGVGVDFEGLEHRLVVLREG